MRRRHHDNQAHIIFLLKLKKRKKKNVEQNQNYECETHIQRKQGGHDRDVYDINNKFVESISNYKIIKREKYFLFIKFSHEEVLST